MTAAGARASPRRKRQTALRPPLQFAACRGREDLFLASHLKQPAVKERQKLCDHCFERPTCLAWALQHEEYGFWGGHDAKARTRLRERYGIVLRHLAAAYDRYTDD